MGNRNAKTLFTCPSGRMIMNLGRRVLESVVICWDFLAVVRVDIMARPLGILQTGLVLFSLSAVSALYNY